MEKTIKVGHQTGFMDASQDSARCFRTLLDVLSRPGRVMEFSVAHSSVAELHPASALVALTLADHESPVWLDETLNSSAVREFVRFHCGAPIIEDPSQAMFAIFAKKPEFKDLPAFHMGTPDYPDRSTTLILQVDGFEAAEKYILSGPGIKDTQVFGVQGSGNDFWDWQATNRQMFPLGLDVILTSGHQVAALPRSVRIEGMA